MLELHEAVSILLEGQDGHREYAQYPLAYVSQSGFDKKRLCVVDELMHDTRTLPRWAWASIDEDADRDYGVRELVDASRGMSVSLSMGTAPIGKGVYGSVFDATLTHNDQQWHFVIKEQRIGRNKTGYIHKTRTVRACETWYLEPVAMHVAHTVLPEPSKVYVPEVYGTFVVGDIAVMFMEKVLYATTFNAYVNLGFSTQDGQLRTLPGFTKTLAVDKMLDVAYIMQQLVSFVQYMYETIGLGNCDMHGDNVLVSINPKTNMLQAHVIDLAMVRFEMPGRNEVYEYYDYHEQLNRLDLRIISNTILKRYENQCLLMTKALQNYVTTNDDSYQWAVKRIRDLILKLHGTVHGYRHKVDSRVLPMRYVNDTMVLPPICFTHHEQRVKYVKNETEYVI